MVNLNPFNLPAPSINDESFYGANLVDYWNNLPKPPAPPPQPPMPELYGDIWRFDELAPPSLNITHADLVDTDDFIYGHSIKLGSQRRNVLTSKWPGVYFQPYEFAVKKTGELKISKELLARLDKLRADFGKPIIINSGFRTKKSNENASGTKDSAHTYGLAADIKLFGYSDSELKDLADLAIQAGFRGLGTYSDSYCLHLDVRKRKGKEGFRINYHGTVKGGPPTTPRRSWMLDALLKDGWMPYKSGSYGNHSYEKPVNRHLDQKITPN